MDNQNTPLRQAHHGRGALYVAMGSVGLYFLALALFNNRPIADEGYHLRAVQWFCDGHWPPPHFLPMLPGYHLLALVPAKLFGTNVLVLRAFNLVMAWAAIALAYGIIRQTNQPNAGDALLHFAWNPVLFPCMVLAYTDLPALLWVVAAAYLYCRQRFVLSALALLLACLMRQSSIVWAGLMAAWAAADVWQQRRSVRQRHGSGGDSLTAAVGRVLQAATRRAWPYGVLGATAIVFFALRGQVTFGSERANRPAFNVAQFYLFGLFLALLWTPIWLACLRREWETVFRPRLMRASGIGFLTAVVALLVLTYENPHPWNQGLDYLKNWPLVMMSDSLIWRTLACLVIVTGGCAAVGHIWLQPQRSMLIIVLLFVLVFLLPQSLAEPRYYIVPVFFINLFARYRAREARRLTFWYGLMSAIVAARVCLWDEATGGVW